MAHLLLGCTAPPPPPFPFDVEITSEHLCLGTEFPQGSCTANILLLDQQVEYVASTLGVPLSGECIPALWTEVAAPHCGPYKGCYLDDVIFSNWQYMPHEIVHAIADDAGLYGPLFIREGLAEALSGKVLRSNGASLGDIIEFGTGEGSLRYSEYEAAGHLTAWMIDYFGIESVVEFYDRLDAEQSKEQAIAVLEDFTGMSASSLESEYANAVSTVYAGKGPFACGASAQELQWEGMRAVGEATFSCDSGTDFRRMDLAQISGYTEELWRGYQANLAAGQYRIELGTTSSAYAVLEACLEEDTESENLPAPPAPVLQSWGDLRQWGFFQWRDLPSALSVPGGLVVELPEGNYTLWLGWVEDPEPGVFVAPDRSFAIERVN